MQSVTDGCNYIHVGQASTALVGGTESMSNIPFVYRKEFKVVLESFMAKSIGAKIKALSMFRWKYLNPIIGLKEGLRPRMWANMGLTAENLAREFQIDREEQDQFALQSHARVAKAIHEKRFSMKS